jgi:hypothetical protein
VNWPMVVILKILNMEHITFHSYNLMMLIKIGLFVINVFVIFGIIKLIAYIRKRASVSNPCL